MVKVCNVASLRHATRNNSENEQALNAANFLRVAPLWVEQRRSSPKEILSDAPNMMVLRGDRSFERAGHSKAARLAIPHGSAEWRETFEARDENHDGQASGRARKLPSSQTTSRPTLSHRGQRSSARAPRNPRALPDGRHSRPRARAAGRILAPNP